MQYIKDNGVNIICPKCKHSNEPYIPVDKYIKKEGLRKCDNCGEILYYDIKIKYKLKDPLKMIQEIKSEDDLCNFNE